MQCFNCKDPGNFQQVAAGGDCGTALHGMCLLLTLQHVGDVQGAANCWKKLSQVE